MNDSSGFLFVGEELVGPQYLDWQSALSFTIKSGDSILLKGPSGVGKSTVLKWLAGVQVPATGILQKKPSLKVFSIPQDRALNEEGWAWEQLEIVQYLGAPADWRARAKRMAREMELLDLNKKVRSLSGGEKERLAVLRAALVPADVLLCDEPFSQCDARLRELSWKVLHQSMKEAGQQAALVFVSHDDWIPPGRNNWQEWRLSPRGASQ